MGERVGGQISRVLMSQVLQEGLVNGGVRADQVQVEESLAGSDGASVAVVVGASVLRKGDEAVGVIFLHHRVLDLTRVVLPCWGVVVSRNEIVDKGCGAIGGSFF